MNLKTNTVGIIGLGYVGLPLAVRCVEKNYKVIGIDLDENKIRKIKKGISPFKEEFLEQRNDLLKKIKCSSNPSDLKKTQIIIICVPTPVDEQFYPDLSPIRSAVEMIIQNIQKGQLIIVESTINPGVCEEVIEPLFAQAGFREGIEYFLAHCPERIDPGNEKWDVTNIPRVVGSMSKKGLDQACKFYESIIDGKVRPMKSIREAEAVKVVENSFRDINIAFVNELAKSFDQMDIDVKDVIEGAAGFDHHILRVAREINNSMPKYTVELLQDLLNELKLPIHGTSIGVMGLSYKANIDDLRESPSIKIIKELKKNQAKIISYDPYLREMSSAKNLNELLKKSKALILVTNHQEFLDIDPEIFQKHGIKAIVDGMNCLNWKKIKKLGIKYHGIGRR